MDNLRIVSVNVKDSITIVIKFTHKLDLAIGPSNVSITSQSDTIPSPNVLKVDIVGDTLTATCQPLTPLAAYFIKFKSTASIIFKSVNDTARIIDDGVSNQYLIIGPTETGNVIQEFLINYLRETPMNVEDNSTIVNKIIQSLSLLYSKALYDIRQLKNENYLSFDVIDEEKVRSEGPFDRLLEEGAYQITRVAKTKTGTGATGSFIFNEFPRYPVSLLSSSYSENLSINFEDKTGSFNINNFTLTVSKRNVSKLKTVKFFYSDGHPTYDYPVSTLGYQIQNSRYDQDFGFTYLVLEDNQFRLSETVLNDSAFSSENISRVEVSYDYRNLGRIIDEGSIEVSTVLSSTRETLPPIVNVFNLENAPIVNSNGEIPSTGGIIFIDPNALFTTDKHPAFLYESVFRLDALPSRPGEFSVDYSTGTVYVYGADTSNNGTGPQPPLATYQYEFSYVNEVDYVYDNTTSDLVSLPNGNLRESDGTIIFNYEEVLVPNVDYKANVHVEELSERIDNRLVALNTIKVLNAPITNVFRIFNETSGEIYSPIRWNNDKIYFSYNNPPNIVSFSGERVSFQDELNEILFVNQQLTNASTVKVFKCLLSNNKIISSSEDSIASSFNTSAKFSAQNVFLKEKWFDKSLTESQNIDLLTGVGDYKINYEDGIVYCAVSNDQEINIGTVSYKLSLISPSNSHVISVEDIYYQTSILNPKDKSFTATSFGEGFINPLDLDVSDEAFLNGFITAPYQINSTKIGAFVDSNFEPGVSFNIKSIRNVYELEDLRNSTLPFNFIESSSFDGRVITVLPIEKSEYGIINHSISDGYYVNINLNLPYLSSNITFTPSVIRNSDSFELWDGSGVVEPGDSVKLILSGNGSPTVGDSVSINYSLQIDDLSRVVVDYNRGDLYTDYTYLADEIIISYEWGENFVDFRESGSISPSMTYYVSYKVGALRDALLKNFGSLVNIPELTAFDINLERERYRDALSAALESFVQGPTIVALKNIVKKISHIEPEIIESVFQNWSLGSSFLNPKGIETSGAFNLLPAKYGNGVLIDTEGQSIAFPVSSNLRLEKGSLECWVIPEWDGIDNDAELKITITRDNSALDSNLIFIGSAEYHPTLDLDNTFSINKLSNVAGRPNKNKDGVFIYYDTDGYSDYKRWFIDVVDGYSFGHVDGYSTNYKVKINTSGLLYDVKPSLLPQPSNMRITSGTGVLNLSITDTAKISEGITFIADREHYLFDFGEKKNKNRFSIYKDPSGYLNFKVADKDGAIVSVSADVSSWKAHEKHHVGISWVLNSKVNRDEMHLFIDGEEVPNIIKYGNKISPYLHEKYRTINPEEIAGATSKDIVGSADLITTSGSNIVSSSINFSAYNISIGDKIYIDEIGFDPNGYVINNINGQALTLASNMPSSLTDAKFSVNRLELPVSTEIDVYPNIAVSRIGFLYQDSSLQTVVNSKTVYSPSYNFENYGVEAGQVIRIDEDGFENHYTILEVDGQNLVLDSEMPSTDIGLQFYIYSLYDETEIPGLRALRPSYSLSKDGYNNNILALTNNIFSEDLIWIKTLGVNHRRVRQKYYQWGDGYDNIIRTALPPPISLDEVKITHILLPSMIINKNNSTQESGTFSYEGNVVEQPSTSSTGRTLSIDISGTENIDFSSSFEVSITGNVAGSPLTEVVSFTENGNKNTVNKFESITDVVATGTYFNLNKSFIILTIKEAYPITNSEGSDNYPVIKYSYQARAGVSLFGSGSTVSDNNISFSSTDIGNYLIISSPAPAAGTYLITAISDDRHSITINGSLASFANGIYQVLNTSSFRSGFQNGVFLLEKANEPGVPYNLKQGLYEFDFYTYLSIKLAPFNYKAFVGSDFNKNNLANCVIDELKITSNKLTDIRIGETAKAKQSYITKDYNSLKALTADNTTLMLSHFDTYPFTNESDFYIISQGKNFTQADVSVNDNFSQSLAITDKPYTIDNNGILDTRKEGTIEFWVNSMFDSANDPNYRFYFDAAGVNIEHTTSLDDTTVQIAGRASKILSVKLQNGDQRIDYFAGGKIEIDTDGAIQETSISTNDSSVSVSKKILQVVSVKIVNDPTNTDYFAQGAISSDGRTIYLGKTLPGYSINLKITYKAAEGGNSTFNKQVIRLKKRLPNQNTPVVITYIPSGLHGDRMSIYKDPFGYVNFTVRANEFDYQVRAPIFWSQNTWHRIKATFSLNGGKSNDQIRLFVDGYEYKNILFGTGLLFGDPYVVGASYTGSSALKADIKFKDLPNELFIGTEYDGKSSANCLIDNLRISNIARPVFAPFGESIDVNYNSNLNVAFPVKEDLYTTFLLDFDTILLKNDDFVMLKNKNSGIFDFSVNIFDSFGIINSSLKVQEVLEKLIKILKPANSRVFLKYIK